MKKSDIEVGVEYAVAVDRYMRQGTRAGDPELRRATVTGWTTPRFREPALVQVKLAEPYANRWGGAADRGKTDFDIPTRKVVATWAEHEPALAAREQARVDAEAAKDAKDAWVSAARDALRALIPVDLQPEWLSYDAPYYFHGGDVTPEQLLAIVQAVR